MTGFPAQRELASGDPRQGGSQVDGRRSDGSIEAMIQNLTDQDIESIALRVVDIIGERLAKPAAEPAPPAARSLLTGAPERLAYSKKELCAALGLSGTTLWRLEALGRIRPVAGVRYKIFSRKEVERSLNAGAQAPTARCGKGRRR